MLSSYDLNELLISSCCRSNYKEVLQCLGEGARATSVSASCGRNAIGTAALMGGADILELLIQSCENPDLHISSKTNSSTELETDSTPDGMDNLEWEDEFIGDFEVANESEENSEQHASLYYYYAKTFEQTGAIICKLDEYCFTENRAAVIGEDLHNIDANGCAPLHYAAACGNTECAALLLEHGARVDAVNGEGYTPLHVGVEYQAVTRLLLKHGANPNLKTLNTGETVLHLAIRNGYINVANDILQSNVNINATDDFDSTPLMCAIISRVDTIAYVLIEKGARINLQDRDGHTALYHAVEQNNVPMAARLLEMGARRVTSHYLLHHCVLHKFTAMTELLINYGLENINVRNKDGVTPTLLAILCKNFEILDYLKVVAGTQLHGRYSADCIDSELLFAVQYLETLADFRPVARILFAHSSSEELYRLHRPAAVAASGNPFDQPPLVRAIVLNKLDIAEFLIKEGFDIAQIYMYEEMIRNLCAQMPQDFLKFAKFLLAAGYKFPNQLIPSVDWSSVQRKAAEDLQHLSRNPLTLQALSRIVTRQQISLLLTSSKQARSKYRATKLESSHARIIKELQIPKVLQTYLIDFDDCTSAIN